MEIATYDEQCVDGDLGQAEMATDHSRAGSHHGEEGRYEGMAQGMAQGMAEGQRCQIGRLA